MVKDKTAIEELKDFAKKTNRTINFKDETYAASGINPRNLVKQQVVLSNATNEEAYFVSYCDMAGIGDKSMYSGLFFSIDLPVSTCIKLRQKNILDKMNLFAKKSEFKTQSKSFNSKCIIEANDEMAMDKLFYKNSIQALIVEIFSLDPRLKLCVNYIDIDIVPELNNQSIFGIYITEQWLLDESLIKKLYTLVEKLRKKLIVVS